MPSAKFVYPKNTDTIPANQTFTIKMVMNNFSPGSFVNAKENYFAAPQTVDQNGNIVGKLFFPSYGHSSDLSFFLG